MKFRTAWRIERPKLVGQSRNNLNSSFNSLKWHQFLWIQDWIGKRNARLILVQEWWKVHLPYFLGEEFLFIDFNSPFLWNCAVDHHDIDTAPILVKTAFLDIRIIAHAYIKVPIVDFLGAFDMFSDMLAITHEVLDPVGHPLGSCAFFWLHLVHFRLWVDVFCF